MRRDLVQLGDSETDLRIQDAVLLSVVTFALAGSLASGDVAAPGLGDLNWAAAEALTELAEAARARGERLPPHFPAAADADLSDHVEFVLGRIGGLVRAQRNLRDFRLLFQCGLSPLRAKQ